MSIFHGEAIDRLLAGRTQEIQTLLGIRIVLVLLVAGLIAGELLRTRRRGATDRTRLVSASVAGLLVLFGAITSAGLDVLT